MDITGDFLHREDQHEWKFSSQLEISASQNTVTSGYGPTPPQSSSVQALESCKHPQQAAYSFGPLAASNTGNNATLPASQAFQQGRMPFLPLADASVQPSTATDVSVAYPYAGLNPGRDVLEPYKHEIQTLYASNTLEAVQRKVNRKYGLKASVPMYKNRIREWGFKKHMKGTEKAAIVRNTFQRSRAGKRSEVHVPNIRNVQPRLARFCKENNIGSEQQALALRPTTPPGLIWRTPSPSPPWRTPRELESPEIVARTIRDYLCGRIESGAWRITEFGFVNQSRRGRSGVEKQFEFCCFSVRSCFELNNDATAVKWLNLAMGMVANIIRCESPEMVVHICFALCRLKNGNFSYAVLRHFEAMSAILLDHRHPFRLLFGRFRNMNRATIKDSLALGVKVAADTFARKAGRFNLLSLSSWHFSEELIRGESLNQKIDAFSLLARELRDGLGPDDCRYWNTRHELAQSLLKAKRYQEAAEIAESLVEHTAAANNKSNHRFALFVLAKAQNALCKTTLAERNIREVISLSVELDGWEDAQTLRYMSYLRRWLEDWGRAGEAADIRTEHDNIFITMFDKFHLEEEKGFRRYGITNASVC